jgi:hypothetical protein
MMPQILASTNLLQDHQCNRKMEKEIKITMLVCRICGEAGHPSKECPEMCHRCTTSHSTRECPRYKVTCFLCDGINHVPKECKFYFMVQQMNQQAREKLKHLIEGALEAQAPKVKMEAKGQEETPDTITRSDLITRRQEHLPGKCNRKRERFPMAEVEYQENEIKNLLALVIPTKKKRRRKQDCSHITCFHCREQGHYVGQCPEKGQAINPSGSIKKDLSHITSFKCKKQGHYLSTCSEGSTTATAIDLEDP